MCLHSRSWGMNSGQPDAAHRVHIHKGPTTGWRVWKRLLSFCVHLTQGTSVQVQVSEGVQPCAAAMPEPTLPVSWGGWREHGIYHPDSTAPVPTASLGISAGCWVAPVAQQAHNCYLRHLRPKFCCSASLDGFYPSFYCLVFWSFHVPGSWQHYME